MRRLTAYEIAGNPDDVIATHAGPDANGKYYGCITRGEQEKYRMLISTGPLFDTPESAEAAMQRTIAAVTEWAKNDLEDPRNLLVNILTKEEGPVIRSIVEAAKA